MEAEARMILAQAVQEKPGEACRSCRPPGLHAAAVRRRAADRAVDDFIEERRREARRELAE
jgi:hypothetical protein